MPRQANPLLPKATLRRMYTRNGLTIHEIAAETERSPANVYKALVFYEIPRRKQGPFPIVFPQPRGTRIPLLEIFSLPGAAQIIQRFKDKVEWNPRPRCSVWTGRLDPREYGFIGINGVAYGVHRFAYVYYNQVEIGDLMVCHSCDNPPCVTREHLWTGTVEDNNADRHNKGRTRCGPGGENHPFAKLTEEQVREMRFLHKEEGYGYKRLAKKYGVSRSTAMEIVKGIWWKHLL